MNGTTLNKKLPKQIQKEKTKILYIRISLCLILTNIFTYLLFGIKSQEGVKDPIDYIRQQVPSDYTQIFIQASSVIQGPKTTPRKVSIIDKSNKMIIHQAYLVAIESLNDSSFIELNHKTQRFEVFINNSQIHSISKLLKSQLVVIPHGSYTEKKETAKSPKRRNYEIIF